jgi:hypothetical protein
MGNLFARRGTQGPSVPTAIEMLRTLENQNPMNCMWVVTRDESWIFLDYSRNHAWRLGDENAPEKVPEIPSTETHRLTVFWSIGLGMIAHHATFNRMYFYEIIILP